MGWFYKAVVISSSFLKLAFAQQHLFPMHFWNFKILTHCNWEPYLTKNIYHAIPTKQKPLHRQKIEINNILAILNNLSTSILTCVIVLRLQKDQYFKKMANSQLCRVYQEKKIKSLHSELMVISGKYFSFLTIWPVVKCKKECQIFNRILYIKKF